MAFEAVIHQPGAYRIFLEDRVEGVYVNVFESATATEPYIDVLQSHLEMAKLACKQDYGIEENQWIEVPNQPWHAPAIE